MLRYKKAITVCRSLKQGAGVYQACQAAGICYSSLWKWRNENDKFGRFVDKLMEGRTQLVVDALYKNAMQGNTVAQIFWLKNKAGWKDGPLIDQSVNHASKTFVYLESKAKEENGAKSRIAPELPAV